VAARAQVQVVGFDDAGVALDVGELLVAVHYGAEVEAVLLVYVVLGAILEAEVVTVADSSYCLRILGILAG
jgi:hypothetical protein